VQTLLLRVFQRQVHFQCQALLVAAHELDASLLTADPVASWIALQALLDAGSYIARALWGEQGVPAESRAELRESLEVEDSSPLRELASTSAFERFGVRLEEWWGRSRDHDYVDLAIAEQEPPSELDGLDLFRVLNPASGELVLFGERFQIEPLVQEASRLLPLARVESEKPHWESPTPELGEADGG